MVLIAGEDLSTSSNRTSDDIKRSVSTLDTCVWVRFQRKINGRNNRNNARPPPKSKDNTTTSSTTSTTSSTSTTASRPGQRTRTSRREQKEHRYRSPAFEKEVDLLFGTYDKNGDNVIDFGELCLLLRSTILMSFDDEHARHLMALLDRDGSKEVDKNEFHEWIVVGASRSNVSKAAFANKSDLNGWLNDVLECIGKCRKCHIVVGLDQHSIPISSFLFHKKN